MKKIHTRFGTADLHAVALASAGVCSIDNMPTAADFNARRVTNPAQSEIVRQRFYDNLLYPAAGVAQLSFFSQPVGQGVTTAQGAVVGSGKTQWDTNLEIGNSLPSGKSFMVESIEVLFMPGSSLAASTFIPAAISTFAAVAALSQQVQLNDVNVFYQSGMLELNILSKNYLRETPVLAFPPKAHFDLSAALATNSATTSEVTAAFIKAAGRPYYISPEIALQPAVNFEVLIRYPAAVAMPSTFNGRVGVYLDGFFMRASQ